MRNYTKYFTWTNSFNLHDNFLASGNGLFSELVDITSHEYHDDDNRCNELKIELNDFVLRELYAVTSIRFGNEAVPAPAFFPCTEKQEQKRTDYHHRGIRGWLYRQVC